MGARGPLVADKQSNQIQFEIWNKQEHIDCTCHKFICIFLSLIQLKDHLKDSVKY